MQKRIITHETCSGAKRIFNAKSNVMLELPLDQEISTLTHALLNAAKKGFSLVTYLEQGFAAYVFHPF